GNIHFPTQNFFLNSLQDASISHFSRLFEAKSGERMQFCSNFTGFITQVIKKLHPCSCFQFGAPRCAFETGNRQREFGTRDLHLRPKPVHLLRRRSPAQKQPPAESFSPRQGAVWPAQGAPYAKRITRKAPG
ncbi:hypothetical protein, partial [Paenibacillus dendritiformis]